MIKLTNISNKNHTFYVGTTQDNLPAGASKYYDDNLISEIEKVADRTNELVMVTYAGITPQVDEIPIIGRGQGANKTTTGLYGITVTEDFGVLDELFIHWVFNPLIIRSEEVLLDFGLSPLTTEVGKTASFQIDMLGGNGGLINAAPSSTKTIVDIDLPDTAFESVNVTTTIPISEIADPKEDISIRVRRIASSNDLVGDVALHHIFAKYNRYLV